MGRKLSPGEVSQYWTRATLTDIRQDPVRWLRQLTAKAVFLVNVVEIGDTDDQYTYAEWSFMLRILTWLLNFGTLCPLLVLGVIVTWPERWRFWVLYGLILSYGASVLLFYVFARYRFPLVPLMLLLAAAGLTGVRAAWNAGRAQAISYGAALSLITAYACNTPAWSVDRIRATTHYSMAATLVNEKSDYDGAIIHCAAALKLNPNLAPARHAMAVMLLRQGRYAEAVEQETLALQKMSNFVDVRNTLGEALLRLGKYDEAGPQIEAALELQPGNAPAHYNAAILLEHKGDLRGAAGHLRAAVSQDPTSAYYRTQLEMVEKALAGQ